MKYVYTILLLMCLQSVHAQTVVQSMNNVPASELKELFRKYRDDVNLATKDTLIRSYIRETLKLLKHPELDSGFVVTYHVFVNSKSTIDHVIFEGFNVKDETLNKELKRLLEEQFSNKKLLPTRVPYMYSIGLNYGKIKRERQVRVSGASLNSLEKAKSFQDSSKIKILYFNQLGLKEIPSVVYRFPNLEELYLEHNEIEALNLDLKRLPNLSSIYLQSNQVSDRNIHLKKNKQLKSLNLSENRLNDIPKSLKNCQSLRLLILAGNKLTKITNRSFSRIVHVNDLNLYRTQLIKLPKSIRKLKNLQTLDLYHNELMVIPKQLTQLSKLKELALSNNKLTALPEDLFNLKYLEVLYAHHNQLSQLPKGLAELKNLQVLDIGFNWFNEFPIEILKVDSLEELDFSNNNIKSLPLAVFEMKNIKRLFFRNIQMKDTQDLKFLKDKIEDYRKKSDLEIIY